MTRTKEQVRKAIFGKLKSLRRKLNTQGVPCTYSRSVLLHDNGSTGFMITCRLADDQATLLPRITILSPSGIQGLDHMTFDQGLARIRDLFQRQNA